MPDLVGQDPLRIQCRGIGFGAEPEFLEVHVDVGLHYFCTAPKFAKLDVSAGAAPAGQPPRQPAAAHQLDRVPVITGYPRLRRPAGVGGTDRGAGDRGPCLKCGDGRLFEDSELWVVGIHGSQVPFHRRRLLGCGHADSRIVGERPVRMRRRRSPPHPGRQRERRNGRGLRSRDGQLSHGQPGPCPTRDPIGMGPKE